MMLRFSVCLVLAALTAPASAVGTAGLLGEWEAAVSADNERLYIKLRDKGKAEIVSEYDFQPPGQPGKQRGRATTYGKWTLKGNEVVLSYAKVQDRLRYSAKMPLSEVGLMGSAPGLKAAGKVDPKSRIGNTILWKAPHEYKLKPPESPLGEKNSSGAAPRSPASLPPAETK
jgi:hypothetical protein